MPSTFPPVDEQLALLERGAVDLIEKSQLADKLTRSRESGTPLAVKAGFDPSTPDLHLGHAVLLRKMRQFQQLGHRVIFLLGDFTARIGDPSGRKAARPQLSAEQIEENLGTYARQVFHILDRDATVIDRNSRWLDQLGSDGLVQLASRWTLARMMERDDFRSRFQAGQPVGLHELLYPLVQGYDSIVLECDVELGGHDQIFNLLVGRDLMRDRGIEPQVVLTVPLLVGLDGQEKMSKSLGNSVALEDAAGEMFGKTMSIPDSLLWDWFVLLTELDEAEIATMRESVEAGVLHPKEAKLRLARRITATFHGPDTARHAQEEFERVFAGGGVPDEMPEHAVPGSLPLAKLLAATGLVDSNSEARRLVQQGAVSVDGDRLDDPFAELPARVEPYLFKVGKRRFARVTIR